MQSQVNIIAVPAGKSNCAYLFCTYSTNYPGNIQVHLQQVGKIGTKFAFAA